MQTNQSSSLPDDPQLSERLRSAETDAEAFGSVTVEEIRTLAGSESADARLLAIKLMDREIYADRSDEVYFAIGESLIEDEDNTCRWQALMLVGEFIEKQPEEIWRIVEKYGQSTEEDMRSGIACVLLEHLLEHFKVEYEAKADALAQKSKEFAKTLRMCWDFCD